MIFYLLFLTIYFFNADKNIQERSGSWPVIHWSPGAGSLVQDYGSTTLIKSKSMVLLYKYLM
jgi:hypothetical protein